MAVIVSLVLFAILVAMISLYGYYRYARPGRVLEQLGPEAVSGVTGVITPRPPKAAPGVVITVIQRVGEKVPVSPGDVSVARRYLMAAGYRSDTAVATYYGIKVIASAVLLALALVFGGYIVDRFPYSLLVPVAAVFAGWFGPGLILDMMVGRRQEELRLSLPDALDLLVICVEAGIGLDEAINRVSKELDITHPDIAEEFALVNLEMRAGKRRAEALMNLADRTGVVDIRRFVAILTQSDRFGTNMADSLRTHSDFMRVKRRQEAEERAGKVGVKLVFPIFFCILPAMMLVVAGAGILQLVKQLFPMMRNVQQVM